MITSVFMIIPCVYSGADPRGWPRCPVGHSQALAGPNWGGDGVPAGGQWALPCAAVAAGGVIQEVQIDDQGVRGAAKVGALGGIEQVPSPAVGRFASRTVAQGQKQPTGVLLQPPDIDGGAERWRQLDPADERSEVVPSSPVVRDNTDIVRSSPAGRDNRPGTVAGSTGSEKRSPGS